MSGWNPLAQLGLVFGNIFKFGDASLDASALTGPHTVALPDADGTFMLAEQQMQNLVSLGLAWKLPLGSDTWRRAPSAYSFAVMDTQDSVMNVTTDIAHVETNVPANCLIAGIAPDGDAYCVVGGAWLVRDESSGTIEPGTPVYFTSNGGVGDSPTNTDINQCVGIACSGPLVDGGNTYVRVSIQFNAPF